MSRGSSVLAGVAVRRVVTTEGCAALLARAQVDPFRADLDALIAHLALRVPNRGHCLKMRAGPGWRQLLLHQNSVYRAVRRVAPAGTDGLAFYRLFIDI